MRQQFRALLLILGAVAVGLLELILVSSEIGEPAELFSTDLWFQMRGEAPRPDDVVLLAMDEPSYSQLGIRFDQVWPRALHAKMLQELRKLGAKRVVMDILFLAPGLDPEVDLALSDAMRDQPTVIAADTGGRELQKDSQHVQLHELLEPVSLFANAAERVALAKMPEDYGYIRRMVLPRTELTEGMPTLYEAAVGGLAAFPQTPRARDLIWFYGGPGRITTYSYHQLLEGGLPPAAVKNKIVFVGLALRTGLGPEQKDAFLVPFGEARMAGVEIHATATANLLDDAWIRRSAAFVEQTTLFVVAVVLALCIFLLPPQWSALVVLGGAGLWFAAAYTLFLHKWFVPGVTLYFITLPLTFMGTTLVYYMITHRARRKVERAFTLYLPKQMAKQMRQSPKALRLGGESVNATALFTDIAGFTTIAEGMQTVEVSNMLNDYFTVIVRAIFAQQGTLIKFIGDAVFAIFGAPIHMENHCELACRSVVGIKEAMAKFNAQKKYPELVSRIGIATGDMLVGNLGSVERFDYTAVGDTVNLASRLESLNKYFGTDVLVSGSTVHNLNGSDVQAIKLARARVKGKNEVTELYTLNDGSVVPIGIEMWNELLNDLWSGKQGTMIARFMKMQREGGILAGVASLYLKTLAGAGTGEITMSKAGELLLGKK